MRRHGILGLIGALALAIGLGFLWVERTGRAAIPASAEPTVNPLPELAREPDPVERSSDARRMEAAIPAMEAQPAAEGADASSAASFRIRVVEKHTQEPIAGARVTLLEVEPPLVKETDEQGYCQLPEPATQNRRLLVEKEGFHHVARDYQGRPELTISLAPITTLLGRVLAADTLVPVPDARIRFGHEECEGCDPVVVTSGADGRFELAGVPRRAGTRLVVDADGFAQNFLDFEIRSDAERVEQDFRLQRGFEISGRVVDFESGAGIPGAKVGREITADGFGSFRGPILGFPGLDPFAIWAEAPGYCEQTALVDPERQDVPLEFRLPRGAIVEGIVRDSAGAPIRDAHVRIHEDQTRRQQDTEVTIEPTPLQGGSYHPEGYNSVGARAVSSRSTDEEGRFRVTGLVPWSQVLVVECVAEGYVRGALELDRVGGPGETTRVELVLGRAPAEGTVDVSFSLNGSPLQAKGILNWTGLRRSGVQRFHSGRFRTDVESGDVAFRIELDDLPVGLDGSAFELSIEPGAVVKHTVELRLPTRSISGRVTFEDGSPAAKAKVEADCLLGVDEHDRSSRMQFSTEAGADGRYVVDVPEGERDYRVTACSRHGESSRDGVRAGASDVDHVLPTPGRLLFRIMDGSTRAALDHRFHVELAWKRSSETAFRPWRPMGSPDADGWFEDWLPSGQLDLRARNEYERDYALLEGVLIPSTGAAPRLEFVLQRLRPFLIQFADDCPTFPRHHSVVLIREDVWPEVGFEGGSWRGVGFPSLDSGSEVEIRQQFPTSLNVLEPGRYRFKVHPPDLVIEPGEVLVQVEMSEPVIVRWRWSR